uniref:Thiazole synthase n=1 Tax=Yamadaella caenomyce TaxID=259029 RepID=A0A1G4NYH7_9FLOR|nr:thiG protein [Yamadaella caenomyce]SCW23702.1 thiG protein [Yamadaella caenomyce]
MNLVDSSKVNDFNKSDKLLIADRLFGSRLMLGTGKYENLRLAQESISVSQASMVTVAMRRLQSVVPPKESLPVSTIWTVLSSTRSWILPNTAGCTTSDEAIRLAALGREMCKRIGQEDNSFVKLEVIPDPYNLFPDPIGTLKAAEYLISRDYVVLPYIYPDPILAKQFEELGCASVMPLGSPIGSGLGLQNQEALEAIINNAKIPVIVDAGIGTSSDAVKAMEMGASAVLVNSAVAYSKSPPLMAYAIKLGVLSGRAAYLAKRMSKSSYAVSSSPSTGLLN